MSTTQVANTGLESEEIADLQRIINAHVAKHGADSPRRRLVAVRQMDDAHRIGERAESIDRQAEAEGAALDVMASYNDEFTPIGRKTQRSPIDRTVYMPFNETKAKYRSINGYVTPSICATNPFAPKVDCLAKRIEITSSIAHAPKHVIDAMLSSYKVGARRETTRKGRALVTARRTADRAARVQAQIDTLRDQLMAKARAIVLARKSA